MIILRQGSHGDDVSRLQHLLNLTVKPSPHLVEDGRFGERTHQAVITFQSQHGLKADGIVGPQTWTALGQKMSPSPFLPAAAPAASGGPAWMAIAKQELGIHENSLPGQNNKRIIEYHSTTSLHATDDETPWCSSFVNWVMKQAGHPGTNSAGAKSWLDWGSAIQNPREGSVTVIQKKHGTSDKATGSTSGFHVAFYVSGTATSVRLLGGNQADSVKYSNFLLSAWNVKAYRWP